MNEINTINAETAAPIVHDVAQVSQAGAYTAPTIAAVSEVTSPTAGPGVTAVTITDADIIEYLMAKDPLVLKFKDKLERVLNTLDFLKDDSWIEHAINGLDKPNIDDRLRAQTETFVKKDLRNKAAEVAEAGKPYVAPTAADIEAAVKRKLDKRMDEIKAKQDRKVAAAKAAIGKK